MFRITEDSPSESLVQCLAKKYKKDCIVSVHMDKLGGMAAYSDPLCMYFTVYEGTLYIVNYIINDGRCKHKNCIYSNLTYTKHDCTCVFQNIPSLLSLKKEILLHRHPASVVTSTVIRNIIRQTSCIL